MWPQKLAIRTHTRTHTLSLFHLSAHFFRPRLVSALKSLHGEERDNGECMLLSIATQVAYCIANLAADGRYLRDLVTPEVWSQSHLPAIAHSGGCSGIQSVMLMSFPCPSFFRAGNCRVCIYAAVFQHGGHSNVTALSHLPHGEFGPGDCVRVGGGM